MEIEQMILPSSDNHQSLFETLLTDGQSEPDNVDNSNTCEVPIVEVADPAEEQPKNVAPVDAFQWLPAALHVCPCGHLVDNQEPVGRKAKKSAPQLKRKRRRKRKLRSTFADALQELVYYLLDEGDCSGTGNLSKTEFKSLFKSPTLGLDLNEEDVDSLFIDCKIDKNKKVAMSLNEFKPLATHLLCLHYSKQDAASQNAWCAVRRKTTDSLIYFNKLTGEARYELPEELNLKRDSNLLEKALQEHFEAIDSDDKGTIKVQDFIQVLTSTDFGLLLTEQDVEEILAFFKGKRGKIVKISFRDFLPVAKRIIMAMYSARYPTMGEWCHLFSQRVGSFWFNKRTGVTQQHAPNHFVRMQQRELEHREAELNVFHETAVELKTTQNELSTERKMKEDYQSKYNTLSTKQEALLKGYESVTRQLEKLKSDFAKKQKQIDVLERDAEIQRKKFIQLESTAAEAERTEANLEHLREVLRNNQTLVRERDIEIRDLNEILSQQGKDLTANKKTVEEQTIKIKDLHNQVRDELRRNEQIEKELDKVPAIRKEKENVSESLVLIKKQLEEKKAQLTLARRKIKDLKAKIQKLEEEVEKHPEAKEEVNLVNLEIETLKKTTVGKDECVAQESQELQATKSQPENEIDHSKKCGQASYPDGDNVKIIKKEQMENVNELNTQGEKPTTPNSADDRKHKVSQQERAMRIKTKKATRRLDVGTRPYNCAFSMEEKSFSAATGNSSFMRLLTNGGFRDDALIYDIYNTDRPHSSAGHSSKTNSGADRLKRPKSCGSLSDTGHFLPSGTLLYEDDFLAAQFLHVCDRVCVKLKGQTVANQPEGKLYTAIVKFIGKLDRKNIDHRLHVGIKLDEPLGDTDGVVRGKRYFRVSHSHGKFIRIIDVVSVLNQKTCSYKLIKECVRQHRLQTGTIETERDRKPCLIRVT